MHMSSEQPVDEQVSAPPPPSDQPPDPPPPETGEAKAPEKASEDAWKEDYEDVMEPEKPPKPKKNRHWGAIITAAVIVIILVAWTLVSPKMLPAEGMTYVDSPDYAKLGNFTGFRDIWIGNTTWGVSITGPETAAVGEKTEFKVLFTKVEERTSNFFFRGTAIDVTNVSLFNKSGQFLGAMKSKANVGFGVEAIVEVTFTHAGSLELYVTAKFTVYEDMRIGYFPVETVSVPGIDFNNLYPVSA